MARRGSSKKDQLYKRIWDLRLDGLSANAIAERLGIGRSTVYRHLGASSPQSLAEVAAANFWRFEDLFGRLDELYQKAIEDHEESRKPRTRVKRRSGRVALTNGELVEMPDLVVTITESGRADWHFLAEARGVLHEVLTILRVLMASVWHEASSASPGDGQAPHETLLAGDEGDIRDVTVEECVRRVRDVMEEAQGIDSLADEADVPRRIES